MDEIHVHEREDARIERILALIDEAARPRPLPEVLGALCAEVAAIIDAPVASIYVRDPADDRTLVMQANEGFPGGFIGNVRLAVGEGITGFAAACMRPVTVTVAAQDSRYKAVPGLPEGEFPVFLALPILVGHRAEAVLVMQRRKDPFGDEEVVLATALATCFAYALERARARREEESDLPRSARLSGRSRAPGIALGRVETLPTFEGLAAVARARGADDLSPDTRAERAQYALESLGRDLGRVRSQLAASMNPEGRDRMAILALLWDDGRLRELMLELVRREPNPAAALREVARTYARVPYQLDREADPAMTERSAEIESLCLQVAARIVDERIPSNGAALLGTDHLGAIDALIAVEHGASAFAVGGALPETALSVEIARAASLPLLDAVGGLFAWARSGDRLLTDADSGIVEVNPSATTIARFRKGS